ncbi:hypothetical protein ACHAWF_005226 [Thalassiosira exigua]
MSEETKRSSEDTSSESFPGVGGKRKADSDNAGEIHSSLHGRKRRKERGISKAAFAAAVKHGEKIRSINPKTGAKQWIFEYKAGGITVITDKSCTHEVTSWAHPCWGLNVEKAKITKEIEDEHQQAIKYSTNHKLWNSHAVAVVDQSGSMRNADTEKGVSRSDLVWICLAIDYVGKRLRMGDATSRDYFTLVLLGPTGTCLIKEHPFNWILYNKIIDLLRTCRPLGHGNYLPALDCAKKMLLSNNKGSCLLQLIFLTDGAPSDQSPRKCGLPLISYQDNAVSNHIASIARKFGSRLTFGAIAVGNARYSALEAMIGAAQDYNCTAFLYRSSLNADDMSSAFRSMSTLMSSTKLTVTDRDTNRQRTFRDLLREPKSSVDTYLVDEKEWIHFVNIQTNGNKRSVKKTFFNRRTRTWDYPNDIFHDSRAVGVTVRECIFGEGRERAVRRVREVDDNGNFVGPRLVGKESLFVEDTRDSVSFHKTFCLGQQLAQRMAHRFNRKLMSLPGVDNTMTPTINFLDCHVLILEGHGGVLVERMLDHTKYKKWNNNCGFVAKAHEQDQKLSTSQDCTFAVEDIPQAYSHFTYLASKRKFLVCDLQGVLNTESKPPVFDLTDPAIHYSKMTKRKDFGRTDRGEHGIEDFLETHTCSKLCSMLLDRWIVNPLITISFSMKMLSARMGRIPIHKEILKAFYPCRAALVVTPRNLRNLLALFEQRSMVCTRSKICNRQND